MNYIIFDLEATCWEERKGRQNETIEIGAVMVNQEKEIVDTFELFVKPVQNPTLSNFCTSLTSIQQSDIENAPLFPQAIEQFKNWIGAGEKDYLLCSWGFYDRKQLESDSKIHNLTTEWLSHHISLKHQHGKFKKLRRGVGMQKALQLDGLTLEGTHHRGIDDAKNISKIFIKYFDKWQF